MESVIYRFSLDTRKSGIQNTLQGFGTGDGIARKLAITLTSGTGTFVIDQAHTEAMMYVLDPVSKVVSINACEIEDNTVKYTVEKTDVRNAGLVQMQLKVIHTHPQSGARRVIVAPKFQLEVDTSEDIDAAIAASLAEHTYEGSFTALEKAVAKAQAYYHSRLMEVEYDESYVFHAYYADGTEYVNDGLKDLHEEIGAAIETCTDAVTKAEESAAASKESEAVVLSAEAAAKEARAMAEQAAREAVKEVTSAEFVLNFDSGNIEYDCKRFDWTIDASGNLVYTAVLDEGGEE